ncbi:MAG TPA: hypothetical protein HA294_00885 [Nanoarchaeota archaeon]|nr:hypothetical protein [Candidatus Woesearchaeota archaeon]HIH15037.1 hypothetical protein [Nanoarchaeota archaeon]HIH58540.1 hypothetical protein [Nanoarchaeota archaeon]HIJ05518.1 hypothetical protein [Nanoarchaeota archaeon]
MYLCLEKWTQSFPDPKEANRAALLLRVSYHFPSNLYSQRMQDIFIQACNEELQEPWTREEITKKIEKLLEGLLENEFFKKEGNKISALEEMPFCISSSFLNYM